MVGLCQFRGVSVLLSRHYTRSVAGQMRFVLKSSRLSAKRYSKKIGQKIPWSSTEESPLDELGYLLTAGLQPWYGREAWSVFHHFQSYVPRSSPGRVAKLGYLEGSIHQLKSAASRACQQHLLRCPYKLTVVGRSGHNGRSELSLGHN